MIVFLNFAPIRFMGGAERKIYELFNAANKYEKSIIIDVDPSVSSLYGQLVLNQPFESRDNSEVKFKEEEHLSINSFHFIPFTKQNKQIKKQLNEARVIYIKSDINEILLLIYFGGVRILSKTIAGIRSPWTYLSPIGFWDNLHNVVYQSKLILFLMKKMKKIHVLNLRDYKYFKSKIKNKNITLIPNYSSRHTVKNRRMSDESKLQVIFVGELQLRKGVDIIIEVINNSPEEYIFNIVGKGPMEKRINQLSRKKVNCKYWGYLGKKELNELYSSCDVLLFPSRAEGFSGVILEAMSHGLKIIDSPEISLKMPKNIELTVKFSDKDSYLKMLDYVYKQKIKKSLGRLHISEYFEKKYSDRVIMPKLLKILDL